MLIVFLRLTSANVEDLFQMEDDYGFFIDFYGVNVMQNNRNILITGANGLIGSALYPELSKRGYTIRTLSRNHGDFKWDLSNHYIDTNTLNGIDCVIHLAGETIAQRWTSAAKERILLSRIKSTQLLTKELLRQNRPIKLICASGINYYGYNTLDPVTEQSAPGNGFLAHVCIEWERSAAGSKSAEIREHTTFIRTGVVLTPKGGAMKKMLPPFKAGVGGHIGSGRQIMSWISLEDIVRIYIRAVEDQTLTGAINAVTPNPVSNSEFTAELGKVLNRPTILPFPEFMVKTLFGEMGRETILSNLNVVPEKLQQCGFKWEHADINSMLNALLN